MAITVPACFLGALYSPLASPCATGSESDRAPPPLVRWQRVPSVLSGGDQPAGADPIAKSDYLPVSRTQSAVQRSRAHGLTGLRADGKRPSLARAAVRRQPLEVASRFRVLEEHEALQAIGECWQHRHWDIPSEASLRVIAPQSPCSYVAPAMMASTSSARAWSTVRSKSVGEAQYRGLDTLRHGGVFAAPSGLT